ncbi:MAG: helix-turn-helix domain-containing protein [Lachnospiraceae bacterium]|nr:helix-turn-helix domain-containing protein [Ruminococcus sp.]MCM1276686.1 helix-turn-helix domain-containing protein [Lachnospiraceae bacterium]
MTQQELGSKINCDKGAISRYENNHQSVLFDTMRSFAAIFNVSMDYLAGMERCRSIPTTGLAEPQIELLIGISEMLCKMNNSVGDQPTAEWYEAFGRIMTGLLK